MALLRDFTTGVSRLPYRALGAPVDLAATLMTPLGYRVEKPVMGSEWLIDKAIKAKLARKRTGTGAELAGDVVGGLLDPSPSTEAALAAKMGGLLSDPAIASQGVKGLLEAMMVFHGSPHRINNVTPEHPAGRFDLSKVGTGEGAQAYGHGIYLAEKPDVASTYASAQSPNPVVAKNGEHFEAKNYAEMLAESRAAGAGSIDAAIKLTNRELQAAAKNGPGVAALEGAGRSIDAEILDVLQRLKSDGWGVKQGGHFYTVDLPDEHVSRMLDWDAPLSEQPEAVRKALAADPRLKRLFDSGKIDSQYDNGGEFYRSLTSRWAQDAAPHVSVDAAENAAQAQASAYLRSLGIPGIKYFDGGSRMNVGGNAKRLTTVNGTPIAKFVPNTGDDLVDYQIENLLQHLEAGEPYQKVLQSAERTADPATVAAFKKLSVKVAEDQRTRNFVIFDPEVAKILKRE